MPSSPTAHDLKSGDALLLVDVQRDFMPGGALGVTDGDAIIPVLNRWIGLFQDAGLPIYATRDWHPSNHCSFEPQGGIWPPHCIANTPGAEFDHRLNLPPSAQVISKATAVDRDAYSGFQGTELRQRLGEEGIARVFVAGLATDYCVLQTVLDALNAGFKVIVLRDGIRAVNVKPGDDEAALEEMRNKGARVTGNE